MNDPAKFKTAIVLAAGLVVLSLCYDIAREYIAPGIEGYFQRKSYYEKVISKKGLSLHKGEYWKEQ